MASSGSSLDENVPPDKHNHQALLDASFGLDIPSQANDETKLKGHSHPSQQANKFCAQIKKTCKSLFKCAYLRTNSMTKTHDRQNSTSEQYELITQVDHSSSTGGQSKWKNSATLALSTISYEDSTRENPMLAPFTAALEEGTGKSLPTNLPANPNTEKHPEPQVTTSPIPSLPACSSTPSTSSLPIPSLLDLKLPIPRLLSLYPQFYRPPPPIFRRHHHPHPLPMRRTPLTSTPIPSLLDLKLPIPSLPQSPSPQCKPPPHHLSSRLKLSPTIPKIDHDGRLNATSHPQPESPTPLNNPNPPTIPRTDHDGRLNTTSYHQLPISSFPCNPQLLPTPRAPSTTSSSSLLSSPLLHTNNRAHFTRPFTDNSNEAHSSKPFTDDANRAHFTVPFTDNSNEARFSMPLTDNSNRPHFSRPLTDNSNEAHFSGPFMGNSNRAHLTRPFRDNLNDTHFTTPFTDLPKNRWVRS